MTTHTKGIGPLQGIAMTVTTFVGSGLMVLPALSVSIAQEQTAYSWIFTALIIMPIAIIFALLGAKLPHAGGASHYIGQAFSKPLQDAVGWLFLSILIVGPAVAIKITANYLAAFLGVDQSLFIYLYMLIFVLFLGFGLAGIQTSAKTQTAIVILMLMAIVWLAIKGDLIHAIQLTQVPETNTQWQHTFSAISVIFWCFLGIEVMAHLGGEFKNPARDFPIAMIFGISIVVLCYLAIVFLIFAYQSYGDEQTNNQSIAILVSHIIGENASRWVALGAFIISFANVSIYLLSFGRMIQAMSENNALPTKFKKLNRFGSPGHAILVVNLVCVGSLILSEAFHLKMEWLIEMTNGSFLTVYTLTCLGAWHLLKGPVRLLAIPALAACIFIALQIGESMLFALVMLGSAYLFTLAKNKKLALA